MIDSPIPPSQGIQDALLDEDDLGFDTATKPEMRKKIMRSLREAKTMIQSWDVPVLQTPNEIVLDRKEDDITKRDCGPESQLTQNLAPIVLLRATEQIPSHGRRPRFPFLGWERCEKPIVKEMYHIPGHHFSVFASQNVSTV